jgi:hypothetical protein
VVVLTYISPAVHEGTFFPTSSPPFVVGVFDGSYSNRGEVDLSVILICISFMASDVGHFLMSFLVI